MLDIRIKRVSMEYPEDISFTLTIENPMMSSDGLIPVPFTTNIELTLSSHNLRVLGHPNRINLKNPAFKDIPCEIYFDGISLARGLFNIEDIGETITGSFAGSEILRFTKEKCSALHIGGEYLHYGPQKNTTSTSSKDGNKPVPLDDAMSTNYIYMESYLTRICEQDESEEFPPFVYAPIRNKSMRYNPENLVNFGNQRAMFINPYIIQRAANEVVVWRYGGVMGSIMPAVRVGYLLDLIFYGNLDNNVFNHGELRKVVLQFLYHPTLTDDAVGYPAMESYKETGSGKYKRYYNPKSFFPDIPQIDLVREILKVFCLTLVTESGRFKLIWNSNAVNSHRVNDLTPYNPQLLTLSREDGKFYKYGYSGIEKKTPDDSKNVEAPYWMWHFRATGEEEVCQSLSTNQYFSITRQEDAVDKWKYELLDGGWGGAMPGEDSECEVWDMEAGIKPMDNSWYNMWKTSRLGDNEAFPGPPPYKMFQAYYIPETNSYDDRKDLPRIMLWHGLRRMHSSVEGYSTYPFISGKNKDADGNNIGGITLEFDTINGLYPRYHRPFANWVREDKAVAEIEALLPPDFFNGLRIYEKYLYEGKAFFIRELSVDIRKDHMEPATFDIIEA